MAAIINKLLLKVRIETDFSVRQNTEKRKYGSHSVSSSVEKRARLPLLLRVPGVRTTWSALKNRSSHRLK